MATSPAKATLPLILEETYVRQDEHGRYSLNDLHQAAGGEKRHRPNYWLENKQAKELIDELDRCRNSGNGSRTGLQSVPGISGTVAPVNVIQGGAVQGSFVARELVYAYAMWISPAFNLKVIRTFDALVTGGRVASTAAYVGAATGLPLAQLQGLQDQSWKLITRLKGETQRELRASLYEQLLDVYQDMGKQAPPLVAMGADEPENPIAAVEFWAAYQALKAAGVVVNHHRDPRLIAVNLRQFSNAAAERKIRISPHATLKDALRRSKSPRFHDVRTINSAVLGCSVHCWIFEAVPALEGGAV